MLCFDRERIFDFFSEGSISAIVSDSVQKKVKRVKLDRNSDLALTLEVTSEGILEHKVEYPPGTVRSPSEAIEFQLASGGRGIARGVSFRGTRQRIAYADTKSETSETFRIDAIELDFQRSVQSTSVIEWIANIPKEFSWTEPASMKSVETTSYSVGTGQASIQWKALSENYGGTKALYIAFEDIEFYLIPSIDDEDRRINAGKILYRGCPDEGFRKKVRACLSFALGKPIVFLGYTEYCEKWLPTFMKSVSAFSVDGKAFN